MSQKKTQIKTRSNKPPRVIPGAKVPILTAMDNLCIGNDPDRGTKTPNRETAPYFLKKMPRNPNSQ